MPKWLAAFIARGIGAVYETSGPARRGARGPRDSKWRDHDCRRRRDGTCGRIANAILRSATPCRLAVVPSGTGMTLRKTLGVSRYTPDQVADLVVRRERRELMWVADGHCFLNSCGFGFDPPFSRRAIAFVFSRGRGLHLLSLGQLFTYRGIEVSANGVPNVKRGANAHGYRLERALARGAFKIAPHASILDGWLDACFFSDSNVVERVRLFVGAMRGTHIGMRSVSAASGSTPGTHVRQ